MTTHNAPNYRRAYYIRSELGETLLAVEKATGIGLSHLARFEKRKAGLSIDNLRALAAHYKCTLDALLAEAEGVEA